MEPQGSQTAYLFSRLTESFSVKTSCAFLSSLWLLDSSTIFEEKSFSRLILTEGNIQEIYTSTERNFIQSITSEIGVAKVYKTAQNRLVECYNVIAAFDDDIDQIQRCIEFMKVFNKAYNNINMFFFVFPSQAFLGCTVIDKNQNNNCRLSYPLTEKTDWKHLAQFCFYQCSEKFYHYYSGLLSIMEYTGECVECDIDVDSTEEPHIVHSPYVYCGDYIDDYYDDEPEPSFDFDDSIEKLEDFASDNSLIDHETRFSLEHCINYGYCVSNDNKAFDRKGFLEDVDYYMKVYGFIHSSQINSLELLLEAEEQLTKTLSSETKKQDSPSALFNSSMPNLKNFDLINDPIALMAKLKKDRGL